MSSISKPIPGEDEAFEMNEITNNNASTESLGTPTTLFDEDEEWRMLEHQSPIQGFFKRLWNGPRDPKDETPTFQRYFRWSKFIDTLPEKLCNQTFTNPQFHIILLVVYCSIWVSVFFSLFYPYVVRPPYFYPNDDGEKVPIYSYSCYEHLEWEGHNNACGLNAKDCKPFEDKEYYIRCPALCDRGGWTYSAVGVGEQRVKYRGFEIGGGEIEQKDSNSDLLSYPYRADSFICGAAVHAGIVSAHTGGCARVTMEGLQTGFPSKLGFSNTNHSISFDSFFPASFSFRKIKEGLATGCTDPRAIIVPTNILFGLPVFYLANSLYSYWITAFSGYWTLLLALDPPLLTDPHDPVSVYELFSTGFQRLLPLCFTLYVLWKASIKRTLENGSPFLKVFLWYPLFWLGVMNNITFDRLPVDRLTPKDLKEQPGGAVAVGCIFLTIIICAIIQAFSIWKSGRFKKFFKIYISGILIVVLLAMIPGLSLRIHHYILGIALIPGCATRSVSAYLFQGILLGLVLSGVARWDFASIVETNFSLLRGEAGGRLAPPEFLPHNTSIPHVVSWSLENVETDDEKKKIDGFSLLLNDIEVYVGKNTTIDLDILLEQNVELGKWINQTMEQVDDDSIDLYLRIAQASIKTPQDDRGDYTNAAVLKWPEGIWQKPKPGIT